MNSNGAVPHGNDEVDAPSQVRRGILATYILPLRSDEPVDEELTDYICWLSARLETIVVDNSPAEVFDVHHQAWGRAVRHVRPDAGRRCANGKVHNVLSGLALASHDRVIIADDDVRYDDFGLVRTVALLENHELVRPQNYFDPLPWHAAWDTGRTLLNRAFAADYPGTLAVRKHVLDATGGYDGNVLFENLELMRTVDAAGGRSTAPLDLYVRRLPPTAAHFWGQRVRQAYDEFTRPARMTAELAVLPLTVTAVATGRWRRLLAGALAVMATAEVGRRRGGGTAVFPARTSVGAPLWVGERAICSWIALGNRLLRGGVPYAGGILGKAANSRRTLRRRLGSTTGNHVH